MKNTIEVGKQFQLLVADQFRAASYRVKENIVVGGQEIDIYAEEKSTFGKTEKTFVECKFRTKGTVSNQEVIDFIGVCREMYAGFHAQKFMMISNNGFSERAHQAAKSFEPIQLFAEQDLEHFLSGFYPALTRWVNRYEQDEFFPRFIPLKAIIESKPAREKVNAVNHLVSKIEEHSTTFTMVAGDFGCGKTTLMRHLFYRISKDYTDGKSKLFPIFLPLKTIANYDETEQFISAGLFKEISVTIIPDQIKGLCERNNVVAILDGFDEIKTHSSVSDREESLLRILQISNFAKHIVLTTRPTHFRSLNEMIELAQKISNDRKLSVDGSSFRQHKSNNNAREKYNTYLQKLNQFYEHDLMLPNDFSSSEFISIDRLSKSDVFLAFQNVESKLTVKYPGGIKKLVDNLFSIYDIEDLLTRPLLLDMIILMLRTEGMNIGENNLQIGAGGLYSIHVNTCLTRDYKLKTRQYLNKEERLEFSKRIAFAIFQQNDGLEIDMENFELSILELIEGENESVSRLRERRIDLVLTDIRTCSFLKVTTKDTLSFVHKSFYEYFLALFFRENLKSTLIHDVFCSVLISFEVLYFLASFQAVDDVISDELFNLHKLNPEANIIFRSNVLGAILLLKQVTSEMDLMDCKFTGFNLSKKAFSSCEFKNVLFERCSGSHVRFAKCTFSKSKFFDGDLNKANFENCSGKVENLNSFKSMKLDRCHQFRVQSTGPMDLLEISDGGTTMMQLKNGTIARIRLNNLSRSTIDLNSRVESFQLNDCQKLIITEESGDFGIFGLKWNANCRLMISLSRRSFLNSFSTGAFSKGRGIVFVNDADSNIKIFEQDIPSGKIRKPIVREGGFVFFSSKRFIKRFAEKFFELRFEDMSVQEIEKFIKSPIRMAGIIRS